MSGRAFWLAAVLVSTVWGCGYALVGRSSNLPEDVRDIYVRNLENSTSRAQVDQILTQAIIDEFVTRRGRFRVVNDPTEADAMLTGTVVSFAVRPVTFARQGNETGRATEYEILITSKMEFRRTDSGDVIWQQPFYQFRSNYEIDLNAANYFDREILAIQEVADKFAETLVIDILEGF